MSDEEVINNCHMLPLEVGHGDVRECKIDDTTTCSDVLYALLGRPNDLSGSLEHWSIMESIYERGVLNLTSIESKEPGDQKSNLIVKELRLLEPSQLMYQLVNDACAPVNAPRLSKLSVINTTCEIVIFFNPYFRMLTGLALSHISVFPDPDMTVLQCNRLIRQRLGLDADDDRFELFGNYGKHVARLEPKAFVSQLKAVWEGQTLEGVRASIGFFQFQVTPERAEHELLGIDRASWLYVRKDSGVFARSRKLYCVLKGSTLFIYKSDQDKEKKHVVKDVDRSRVISMGPQRANTRFYFKLVEPPKEGKNGQSWTFYSPYKTRVRKWLRVLGRCRRPIETQIPVSMDDPDGEWWMSQGRVNGAVRQPLRRTLYKERNLVDPWTVTAGEMTKEQRSRFDHIDALFRAVCIGGELVKQGGLEQNAEIAAHWLQRIRHFSLEVTSLLRPGFAEKILPVVKKLFQKASVFQKSLEGSLRAAHKSVQAVEEVEEVCKEMTNVYKKHVLDLASFPASPKRNEMEYGPQLLSVRMFLEDEEYYTKFDMIEEQKARMEADMPEDGMGEESVAAASDIEMEHNVVDEIEVIDDDSTVAPDSSAAASKNKESLSKKISGLFISKKSSFKVKQLALPTSALDSPLTEVAGDVNETSAPIPSRRSGTIADDERSERSVASTRSSFSQRAKELWTKVSSPMRRKDIQPTASLPYTFPTSPQRRDESEVLSCPQTYRRRPSVTVPENYNASDIKGMQQPPTMYPASQQQYPMYDPYWAMMMSMMMRPPMMMMPTMSGYYQQPQSTESSTYWNQMMSMLQSNPHSHIPNPNPPPQPQPNTQQPAPSSPFDGPPCPVCQELIQDGSRVIRSNDLLMHISCFTCHRCQSALTKDSYQTDQFGRLQCVGGMCADEAKQSAGILKTSNVIDVPKKVKRLDAMID